LKQARFEASRAHRQYDAVDPENRLVASNLERRWNESLLRMNWKTSRAARRSATALREGSRTPARPGPRFIARWNSPGVTAETRKKIVRLLISEIVVDVIGDDETDHPLARRITLTWTLGRTRLVKRAG
jgi:hypothetical protein